MTAKKKPETETKTVNINKLSDVPGLGDVSIKRLEEKGITGMFALWAGMNNPVRLAQTTGMDKAKAITALEFIREKLEKAGVIGSKNQTADKTYEEILTRKKLKLGCTAIDNVLRGGFETSVVYEIYGHEGAGKTQMLHTLAINNTFPLEEGGLYDKVKDGEKEPYTLYIDTENTFRPDRIHSILDGKGMLTPIPKEIAKKRADKKPLTAEEQKEFEQVYQKQTEEAMEFMQKHILHWKCNTAASLFAHLQNANGLIATGFPIRLIIIDSLTNVFRGNYVGRGEMWSRSDDMKDMTKLIKDLTEVHKVVLIFTSQVYGSPDAKPWEDDVKAYGGHIIGHAPQIRLKLDKPSGNPTAEKNRLTIVKAMHLPNDQVLYKITNKGIENFE